MIRAFGIRWSVHPLFVLMMLAAVATGYIAELMTLFTIVLIHELGHVLAARGFGWTIREVKLLPFGGVAESDEAGRLPAHEEIMVALAGPLQHVWMGGAALLLGWSGLCSQQWAAYLVQVNVMLGLFNLLPALPLDGGRLLQALFSLRLPYHATLVWGGRVSLAVSALLLGYALAPLAAGTGPRANLLLIGLFLLSANWTYYRNIPFLFLRFLMGRARLAERHVRRGGPAEPLIVPARYSIQGALRRFKRERYHLVLITEGRGAVRAILPEEQLIDKYLQSGKPGSAVDELLR
ncbi:M50 family metallopeptidase [Paenibacillus sp. IB182496]|uniref:M50 family metallopeptidase n=1 Tax=Paenibacillus sabuli TaxID=2772509 RepID=A0A927BRV9_9BACL|nr:M50 family metallopeptidase [Paenibacillus sabuli]MBD2844610.1 M50 family metallopeptidase [Paenibacillus sabuli]